MSRFVIDNPRNGRLIIEGRVGRERRVVVLVLAILFLSVLDLCLTLGYLSTSGLLETNPIVCVLVRSTNSAAALVLFKIGTAGISSAMLLWLRREPQAELGAWCGLFILVWVIIRWHRYGLVDLSGADSIPGYTESLLRLGGLG